MQRYGWSSATHHQTTRELLWLCTCWGSQRARLIPYLLTCLRPLRIWVRFSYRKIGALMNARSQLQCPDHKYSLQVGHSQFSWKTGLSSRKESSFTFHKIRARSLCPQIKSCRHLTHHSRYYLHQKLLLASRKWGLALELVWCPLENSPTFYWITLQAFSGLGCRLSIFFECQACKQVQDSLESSLKSSTAHFQTFTSLLINYISPVFHSSLFQTNSPSTFLNTPLLFEAPNDYQ